MLHKMQTENTAIIKQCNDRIIEIISLINRFHRGQNKAKEVQLRIFTFHNNISKIFRRILLLHLENLRNARNNRKKNFGFHNLQKNLQAQLNTSRYTIINKCEIIQLNHFLIYVSI